MAKKNRLKDDSKLENLMAHYQAKIIVTITNHNGEGWLMDGVRWFCVSFSGLANLYIASAVYSPDTVTT
jgi:hypothetical protein